VARIIVAGYAIRHPLAGNLLAFLHHVLGLQLLGHQVLWLEESGWPNSCFDPTKLAYGDDPSAGLQALSTLMARYKLNIPMCYVNRDSGQIEGTTWQELKRMLVEADLLLNVGGVCWLPEFRLCPRRALIDKDPLFTQVGLFGGDLLNEHHVHFTYGVNIGQPGCTIPSHGIDWLPTAPPVVPELWENKHTRSDAPFTTIASLKAFGTVMYQGEQYGQKDEEFLRFLDLPSRSSQSLELALKDSEEINTKLRSAGWLVRNAGEVSTDVLTYQSYITGSRGEFSVAKNGYVKSRSGWFSDRSVCYLAAGLPVILQNTGYSDWLPAGSGVLPFSSVDEAVKCLESVNSAYSAHCIAARETAMRTFSYQVVLPQLLQTALGDGG
jgi:hypothetical protein